MKPRVRRPRTGAEGAPVRSSGGSWMGFLICLWPEPSWRPSPSHSKRSGPVSALGEPALSPLLCSGQSSVSILPVSQPGTLPATPAPSRGPRASRFQQL